MTKDEALRLALEALKEDRAWLETDAPTEVWEKNNEAITAIKAALEAKDEAWGCVCGANLYIDANGIPRSKASVEPATVMFKPEQEAKDEPVAWRTFDGEGGYDYRTYDMNENYANEWNERNPKHNGWVEPLYTTPPQRTWVGLTDEEIEQGCKESWVTEQAFQSAVWWAEAKLKERNT